jgi:hypothetical protein
MKCQLIVAICFTLLPFAHHQPKIAFATNYHQQQSSWQIVAALSKPLRALDMIDASNGWAVGNEGLIMRWNGIAWSIVSSPTTANLLAVSMISPNDGWAVGSGVILRWNGSNWVSVTSPVNTTLFGLDMVSDADGWAAGVGGAIARWNGTNWQTAQSPITQTAVSIRSLDMISSTSGWAVGGAINSNPGTRSILRWDGNAWNVFSSTTAFRLLAISFSSADVGIAVGSGGGAIMWNGTNWIESNLPNQNQVNGVKSTSPTAAWAVNIAGEIFRWNGTSWVNENSPVSQALNGIDMLSETEGWAVGDNAILRYQGAIPTSPLLVSNHPAGKKGSFFTLSASGFPANTQANIQINGYTFSSTIPVNASGVFTVVLNTDNADNGLYIVTARVNPEATTSLVITDSAPLQPQVGDGISLSIPASIAFNKQVYLSIVLR